MRRIPAASLAAVTAVAAALAAGGGGVWAQSVERHMIVTVLDGDDRPVGNLDPRDFEVREDGAAREVLRVEPAGAGRQIAVLVDTSEAAARATRDFRAGLSAFFDAMHEGNEISLISFGGPPRILVRSTTSLANLQDGLGGVFGFAQSASYLLDAMAQAAEGFARRASPRPVLVALTTEGVDYSNVRSRRVFDRVRESGAAVYTLLVAGRGFAGRADFADAGRQQAEMERNLVLERGPRDSGGRSDIVLTSLGVEHALLEFATELRNQLLVTYARPDALIPPERIEVAVNRAGLTARGIPLKAD
jgi:VWFA-related protein